MRKMGKKSAVNRVLKTMVSLQAGTLIVVCCLMGGCNQESRKKYTFHDFSPSMVAAFNERVEIMGTNLLVNYIVDDDPTDVFSQERLDQQRNTSVVHTYSTNQHIYLLEKDVSRSTVRYVKGFHFFHEEPNKIIESPLQGKTLKRQYRNEEWSEFFLLHDKITDEVAAEIEKLSKNYALDAGIYPDDGVEVGESWNGTNRVIGADGTVSEFSYSFTFERVEKHRGLECARLGIHNVLHVGNDQSVLDLQGYAYYSFKHGIQIDSDISGPIKNRYDHNVLGGDQKISRVVEGIFHIISTISFDDEETVHGHGG